VRVRVVERLRMTAVYKPGHGVSLDGVSPQSPNPCICLGRISENGRAKGRERRTWSEEGGCGHGENGKRDQNWTQTLPRSMAVRSVYSSWKRCQVE
jgi:hypothetical protein